MKNFLKAIGHNLKHLPTTLAGAATIASIAVQHPLVQQAAALNPKVANYVTTVGSIAAGLTLIFGAGKKSLQPAGE